MSASTTRRFARGAAVAVLTAAVLGAPQAQTLRWASQGDPQTMDPHSQNEGLTNAMNGQVYEYLVGRDKQLNLVPQLATEWKQVGPLQWRMKLRPNVKFHDGTPFTADDVVFSFGAARIGLWMKSAAPSSKPRCSESSSCRAVTKTTGIARVASSAWRRRSTS